jgi:hypothetical protein
MTRQEMILIDSLLAILAGVIAGVIVNPFS